MSVDPTQKPIDIIIKKLNIKTSKDKTKIRNAFKINREIDLNSVDISQLDKMTQEEIVRNYSVILNQIFPDRDYRQES